MYRYVFANRWIALLFVAVMAAGAASLVGTEDSEGVIDQATQQITQQRDDFERVAEDLATPDEPSRRVEQEPKGFLDDSDLVDDAEGLDVSGFDPTPDPGNIMDPQPDHDPAPTMNDSGDPVIFGPADIDLPPPPGAIPDEGVVE